jgi:hypothetical protein
MLPVNKHHFTPLNYMVALHKIDVMITTISIQGLHEEYQVWSRELTFYKEEIKIFEDHLATLLRRNTKNSIPAHIEHFQNQFIVQKEVIDFLKHDLLISERQLARFAQELSGDGIDNIRMDNHEKLWERILSFRRIYRKIKNEFQRFEMHWM